MFILIVYFTVSSVFEIIEFRYYIAGKQELWDFQIVKKQLLIWCWPLILIGSILFTFCYAFVCLACAFIDNINEWVN